MPLIQDDLVWFPELEAALEFQGAWEVQILLPPPFVVLCAECRDVPLSLEVYALDPDYYRTAQHAAHDQLRARLLNLTREEYQGHDDQCEAQALGYETDLPTEIQARAVYENDAFYVMAFSAWPGLLEAEQWRVQAMFGAATFGQHRSYGRGLSGLARMVGAHLTESDVSVGRSRAHLGFLRDQDTVRRGRPAKFSSEDLEAQPEPTEQGAAPEILELEPITLPDDILTELEATPPPIPTQAQRPAPSNYELREFERRLAQAPSQPAAPTERWPAPWEPLPNLQKDSGTLKPEDLLPHRPVVGSRDHRAMELFGYAESLPADVSFYAEKVFGVPEVFAYRDGEPFPVMGLDRVPLLLEALLQIRQHNLTFREALPLGEPRRAWSPMGRDLPDNVGVPVLDALQAMIRQDDATAADLIGWRLGWRQVQERLPALGLPSHSVLLPARARALAMTRLPGPFEGLSLPQRVDFWRTLSEDERRATVGQLHKLHLETPLEAIQEQIVELALDDSVSWADKARWALALGPRGCAREYGALFASLLRGEVLGGVHGEKAMELLRPCVGDQLSGGVPGVELRAGKLGQGMGALLGAGYLGRLDGAEVAICVLTRNVRTSDHLALAQQLRILSALIYEHVIKA